MVPPYVGELLAPTTPTSARKRICGPLKSTVWSTIWEHPHLAREGRPEPPTQHATEPQTSGRIVQPTEVIMAATDRELSFKPERHHLPTELLYTKKPNAGNVRSAS